MKNQKITIKELMDIFLNRVKLICNNISETYSIPQNYRNGNIFTLYKTPDVLTEWWNANRHWGVTSTVRVSGMKAQIVVSDRRLNAIPLAQVEKEVSQFLESRGISTRTDTIATTKSMINFFNNVSAFFSMKTVRITYPDGKSFMIYDPDNYAYPKGVKVIAKGKESTLEEQINDSMTTQEYEYSVEDELKFINDIVNSRSVDAVSQQMFVCSSSSSSCSCSSSSCSSSSSSYIVYMMV